MARQLYFVYWGETWSPARAASAGEAIGKILRRWPDLGRVRESLKAVCVAGDGDAEPGKMPNPDLVVTRGAATAEDNAAEERICCQCNQHVRGSRCPNCGAEAWSLAEIMDREG